jgi:hypothetical protein
MLKDPRKKAASMRLQNFFRDLKQQVAQGAEELWRKVERRLSAKESESRDKDRQSQG